MSPRLYVVFVHSNCAITRTTKFVLRIAAVLLGAVGAAEARNPTYVFTTFAGAAGQAGSADAVGAAARFNDPEFLAVDAAGNVYVAETSAHVIRKISSSGSVSTLAGLANVAGSNDGSGAAARFNQPRGIAVDVAGNVYVADSGNHTIRVISSASTVTTFAGIAGTSGAADGSRATATFNTPSGVAVDDSGNVFVADTGNHTVRKISSTGVVIFSGSSDQAAVVDGDRATARFKAPTGLTFDWDDNLWVADANDGNVRKITPGGAVESFPGNILGTPSIAVDSAGRRYTPEKDYHFIHQTQPPDGQAIFGVYGSTSGAVDGPENLVRFNGPSGVAFGLDGTFYVADSVNRTIRKGTPVKITWAAPAAISAGTPLSTAQLNATANVEGTMTYDVKVGDVLSKGNYFLTATFLPTGAVSNLATQLSVPLAVTDGKITPTINWPQPAALTYGTWLTPTQLNATTDVPGLFSYSPAAGTVLEVGSHTLHATFSPSDATKYNSASAEVTLVVNPATGLQVVAQPASQTVTPQGIASFSFVVSGSSTATYWQESRDSGRTWNYVTDGTPYSGASTATLTVSPVSGLMNGYLYRCLVLAASGSVTSDSVRLTVASGAYTGGYFGTFAHGGTWALFVGSPNRFIAYLPNRSSAIVETLNIGLDGKFSTSCAEIIPGAPAGQLTLTGTITTPPFGPPTIAAQLTEISENMTGAFPSSGALTYLSGDFFSANALGAARGNLYATVGYSGDIQVVVVTPDFVDGARGVLDPSGSLSVTTSGGRPLILSIDPQARSVSATLSPPTSASSSGSTRSILAVSKQTAPIQFVGVSQSVVSTSHFVDIATRAYCTTGNGVTIGGFVVNGGAPKRVLIRGVGGPSLVAQGISSSEVLADPIVEVHDASHGNAIIATNDNWTTDGHGPEITQVAHDVGAAAFASTDTVSAAMVLTLQPGVYTFVVTGKNSASGVVLLEVYDCDTSSVSSRFVNIATRAYSGSGNGVAIGGFVVNGNAPKQLLIRAVGPTLTGFGLNAAEVLPDPVIEVHDASHGNVIVATNDNWNDNGAAEAITAAGARVGAAPISPVADTKSAALLMTLKPGVYTFLASDKNNGHGIVLIEVYDAD